MYYQCDGNRFKSLFSKQAELSSTPVFQSNSEENSKHSSTETSVQRQPISPLQETKHHKKQESPEFLEGRVEFSTKYNPSLGNRQPVRKAGYPEANKYVRPSMFGGHSPPPSARPAPAYGGNIPPTRERNEPLSSSTMYPQRPFPNRPVNQGHPSVPITKL